MKGTEALPRRDGVVRGWSRHGSIRIGPEGLVAQGGDGVGVSMQACRGVGGLEGSRDGVLHAKMGRLFCPTH